MSSLTIAVPGEAKRLANDLLPELVAFERVREKHSLLVKRFERNDRPIATLRADLDVVLRETEPFRIRTTGIERFETSVRGSEPVVYLAIESPGLRDLHRRLVEFDGAVPKLEGSDYTPHITLARGGAPEHAERLAGLTVEEIEWTVSKLRLEDGETNRLTIRLTRD